MVHTSGTSGTPKAVELTYGNWLWSALGSAVALGLDPAERWLCALPLSHVGGLSIVMRSAIYATTAIVHERFDTDRVLDALMDEDGPTIVSLVPTTLQRLLDAGLREPPALRWALLGGAPATTALQGRAAAAGVPVAPTYGLTEACSQVTTLGAPLFCTRVRIAGDGEILVSGPTVAGWAGSDRPVLATGDLGEWRPDGALRVAGRKADTIVSGGENVAPAEVEAVLEAHPDVVEAAVHGRADPEWGEAVVATVVADPDVEAEELRAWCAERLATLQGAQGDRLHGGAAAHAVGQGRTKGPQMSDERDELIARWDTMAAGWKATRANFQRAMEPVSQWLVEAIHPQPGHRVLELAAGLGRHRAAGRAARRARRQRAHHRRLGQHGRGRARARRGGRRDERRTTEHAGRVDRPPDGVGGRRHLPLRLHAAARPRGGAARDAAGAQARRARRAGGVGRRSSATRG